MNDTDRPLERYDQETPDPLERRQWRSQNKVPPRRELLQDQLQRPGQLTRLGSLASYRTTGTFRPALLTCRDHNMRILPARAQDMPRGDPEWSPFTDASGQIDVSYQGCPYRAIAVERDSCRRTKVQQRTLWGALLPIG